MTDEDIVDYQREREKMREEIKREEQKRIGKIINREESREVWCHLISENEDDIQDLKIMEELIFGKQMKELMFVGRRK